MPNTIFIYDQCGQETVSFFSKEGDYSHLDQVYVNAMYDSEEENAQLEISQSELVAIIDEAQNNAETTLTFPLHLIGEGTKVIVVGFLP